MMELLTIDGLPPMFRKGGVLRLLIEEGGLDKHRIGKIELSGGLAQVEVAEGWADRIGRKLDGALVDNRHISAWHAQRDGTIPHFEQLNRWLALEATAEEGRDVKDGEYNLTKLVLRGEEVGLGERILLTFAPRNEQAKLPWSRLSVGSPVLVREEGVATPNQWRGIISRMRRKSVEVAIRHLPESENDVKSYRIDLASDEIVRQRMQRALVRASGASGNRLSELRRTLLGQRAAEFSAIPPIERGLIAHLNESQQAAVAHALSAEDIAIIHGPPGTGKTTTLVALVMAAIRRGDRILACAPSNMAVDNLAEKLLAAGAKIVRIGHPARVLSGVQAHTLDALVEQHDDYKAAKKMRREAVGLRGQASKFRRARPAKGEKQALRREASDLMADARKLEAQTVERILDARQVILATLTAINSAILGQRQFDLCVIDEAGQSTEPATWIPLPRARRLVLAGDHQQLPPTVLSLKAQKEGFGVSLLEQLMRRDGEAIARRLDVQYRMHTDIMGFSSAEFYDGTLHADSSVAEHLLTDLAHVNASDLTGTAVTFIDTAGASFDEEREADGGSRRNKQEADLVLKKVNQLRADGVDSAEIAVITPYAAQVRHLRDLLDESVEIGSVDGFQGREKEVIILSLVRSNEKGEVGFLAETRRMNVALTRAKRKLIIIGDSGTITTHPFYARLIDYVESINAYHSVWEEMV